MTLHRWYRCVEFETGVIVSCATGHLNSLIRRGAFSGEGRIVRFFKEYR